MAKAVGTIGIKVGGDLAKGAAEAGRKNIFKFIEAHFGRGSAIILDLELGVDQTVYGKDNPELRALGIEYLQCGKYDLCICNEKPLTIRITSRESATYFCGCYHVGKNYINFNFIFPGIKSIMVQAIDSGYPCSSLQGNLRSVGSDAQAFDIGAPEPPKKQAKTEGMSSETDLSIIDVPAQPSTGIHASDSPIDSFRNLSQDEWSVVESPDGEAVICILKDSTCRGYDFRITQVGDEGPRACACCARSAEKVYKLEPEHPEEFTCLVLHGQKLDGHAKQGTCILRRQTSGQQWEVLKSFYHKGWIWSRMTHFCYTSKACCYPYVSLNAAFTDPFVEFEVKLHNDEDAHIGSQSAQGPIPFRLEHLEQYTLAVFVGSAAEELGGFTWRHTTGAASCRLSAHCDTTTMRERFKICLGDPSGLWRRA